jgi:hypothetical protein
MTAATASLRGRLVLRALVRRRLAIGVLFALPVALYFASHDAPWRAVRALTFGVSWAVSTVAFFAATASSETEPRLKLAGWSPVVLVAARIGALMVFAVGLTLGFTALVAVDIPAYDIAPIGLVYAVTAAVAVAFGTVVGTLITTEMEGTLVLFFFAGLQAVVDPFSTFAKVMPFWASRELSTFAIDGPDQGSVGWGLGHAALVIALCALIIGAKTAWRAKRAGPEQLADR